MKDLISKSPYECYEEILRKVKLAQNELNTESLSNDPRRYIELLIEAKEYLQEVSKIVPEWTDNGGMLTLNLRLLNNYYKHLFTRAIEDRSEEAMSELKYHLSELIAAWRDL